MHGIILCMFDCWADPVVHLLLLKSSVDYRVVVACTVNAITIVIYYVIGLKYLTYNAIGVKEWSVMVILR